MCMYVHIRWALHTEYRPLFTHSTSPSPKMWRQLFGKIPGGGNFSEKSLEEATFRKNLWRRQLFRKIPGGGKLSGKSLEEATFRENLWRRQLFRKISGGGKLSEKSLEEATFLLHLSSGDSLIQNGLHIHIFTLVSTCIHMCIHIHA